MVLHGNDLQISKIYVIFFIKAISSNCFANNNDWVVVERSESLFCLKRKAGLEHWTQFSVTLSYVCILHKIRGISLENLVISFNLDKQKSFLSGQIYVALSRITNIQGMYLITE